MTHNQNQNQNQNQHHHHHPHPPPPPPPPRAREEGPTIRSSHPACAACRYQRRKCTPECLLAKHFPPDRQEEFLNAHKLFGVSNIVKTIKLIRAAGNRPPSDVDEAMKTMIYQSNVRAADPVGGCCRVIWDLQQQIDMHAAELSHVRRQLAFFRAHHRQQQMQQTTDPDALLPPPPPPRHLMDHSSSSHTPSSPSSSSANNVFSYNNSIIIIIIIMVKIAVSCKISCFLLILFLIINKNQQQQQQLMFHNLTLNDHHSQELLGLEEQLVQNSCPNSNFQGLDQWLVHDPSRSSVDGAEIHNQQQEEEHEQKIIIRNLINEKPCKRKREDEDPPKVSIQVISGRVAEDDDQKQKMEVEEKEAKSNEKIEEQNEELKGVVPLLCSTSNKAL
ncbi:hypothetical protein Sjap_011648 [Stephania japonica]|uniref:LOB domain-containing protein n=1 Tax=Stephania japonica TaxID=461633 RepID=A0AAP0JDJ8_9MAGN